MHHLGWNFGGRGSPALMSSQELITVPALLSAHSHSHVPHPVACHMLSPMPCCLLSSTSHILPYCLIWCLAPTSCSLACLGAISPNLVPAQPTALLPAQEHLQLSVASRAEDETDSTAQILALALRRRCEAG